MSVLTARPSHAMLHNAPGEAQDQRAVEAVLHTVLNLVLPLPRSQMGANAATHNPMQIKLVAIS